MQVMSERSWDENQPEIIPLCPSDLNPVYQLDQICFSKEIAFPKNLFAYFLSSPDCASFGIKQNKKLLGFIIVHARTKERGQLVTLDICPEHRRKKIGQKLLDFAHHYLKERGFREIFLETALNNKPAISLYQKLGYKSRGIKKSYYPDGTDALLMEKTL